MLWGMYSMTEISTETPIAETFEPAAGRFVAGTLAAILCAVILVAATRQTIDPLGDNGLALPVFLVSVAILLAGLAVIMVVADRSYRAGTAAPLDYPGAHLTDPVVAFKAPFQRADTALEAALRLEQTAHIFRQLDLMLALNVINALLVALAVFGSVDGRLLAAWLLSMAAMVALGRRSSYGAADQSAAALATKQTIRRLSLHAGLRGVTWGLSFALFFNSTNGTGQLVLLGVALGMVAGGVPSLASVPSAALMFGLGVMIPTLLRLVSIGNLDTSILSLLGLTYCGTMVIIGEQLYRNFATNMTTRRAQAEQAATISLLLNEFETSASDWLWETDGDGRMMRFPARMAALFGMSDRADVMPTLAELMERTRGGRGEVVLAHTRMGEPFRSLRIETTAADGSSHWLSLTASPKSDGGYRGVGSDITSEIAADRAATAALGRAETAEQRLRDGIDSLGAGFILTDSHDRAIATNRHLHETMPAASLLGPQPTFEEIARAQAALWPPGSAVANQAWLDDLLTKRRAGGEPFDSQLPDGRWLRVKGSVTTDGGTVTVLTDITDIKQQEVKLADQSRRLAASNNELVQFATVASHDLQEPLRKIEAFGARLKQRASGALDADSSQYLERMIAATQRMRGLITGLLSYSRVGRREVPFGAIDLDKLLAEVVDDLSVAIAERQATVCGANLGSMRGEATLMRQLFQNLLSNALKFSKADVAPVIEIERVNGAGAAFELRFHDNGIGFDMKYHDKIFEIFQRLHGREAYEGTGVGLATCAKIVERHGGTLRAISAPGEGATFIAALPGVQNGQDSKPELAA